jgi:hypothetical protein
VVGAGKIQIADRADDTSPEVCEHLERRQRVAHEILDVDRVEVEHVERHRQCLSGDLVVHPRNTPGCSRKEKLLLEWRIRPEIPQGS